MASIELREVSKRYGKTAALDAISFSVYDKEFFVLFGPAGAGKTTILKMIAGIEFADRGAVYMNGGRIDNMEPARRNVAMVFENYALYPHMNVYDNIASPLRSPLYRQNEEAIREKVSKIAATMKIDGLADRMPAQLSNGQRQRVALGRCLVRDPNVFLMDEPLAHLDAKLRNLMRTEFKALQKQLNTTVVYVTHDYMEAMSLSDRMAIINKGGIEQIGSPREIYHTPANEFVARLVGEPEINVMSGELERNGGGFAIKIDAIGLSRALPGDLSPALDAFGENSVDIGIRGSHVSYSFQAGECYPIHAKVYNVEPMGNRTTVVAEAGGVRLNVRAPSGCSAEIGQDIWLGLDIRQSIFFGAKDGRFIARHNPDAAERSA
ncbi:MAG: ABC transporter ATP-binding protein [Synergistaceae bacterium]|jgi:ABC-type sugar transport system ATPase subunit|nr:ABC transporter ATP-binding protein [Synergistaceae bacterium]